MSVYEVSETLYAEIAEQVLALLADGPVARTVVVDLIPRRGQSTYRVIAGLIADDVVSLTRASRNKAILSLPVTVAP